LTGQATQQRADDCSRIMVPRIDSHPSPTAPDGEFRELRRLIQEAGLLSSRPGSFALNLCAVSALLVAGIVFLGAFHRLLGVIASAIFLGVVWVQLAFIVHDAGHRQGFVRRWQNALVGIICGDLLSGGSYYW